MFYAKYLELLFEMGKILPPPLQIESNWSLVEVFGLGVVRLEQLTLQKILRYNGWTDGL